MAPLRRPIAAALLSILPLAVGGTGLAVDASGPCRVDGADCFSVAFSRLTGIPQGKLLGRGASSGTGAAELITVGSGLSMAGTTLSATGGGGTPAGASGDLQWNNDGAFAGGGPSWDSGTLEIPTNSSAPGGVRIRNTSDSTVAYSYIEFGDTHGGGFRQFGYLGQGGSGPLVWLSQPGWGLFLWTYGASDDITLKTRYVRVDGMLLKTAFDAAPASATDTGTAGEVRITATYIYVCTATNTWVRAALSTW